MIEQIEKIKTCFQMNKIFHLMCMESQLRLFGGKNRMQKENKSAEKGKERGGNIGIFLRSYQ